MMLRKPVAILAPFKHGIAFAIPALAQDPHGRHVSRHKVVRADFLEQARQAGYRPYREEAFLQRQYFTMPRLAN